MLVSVHGLALVACAISYIPIVFKLAGLAVIGVHLYIVIKHFNGGHLTIRHSEAFAWEVWGENGFESVQILHSTVVSLFAVILHIKRKTAPKQAILVLSDALSEDAYRHLIVRLKTTVTK